MRRVVGWIVLGLVILWVVQTPSGAAHFVHSVFHSASALVSSLGS